MNNVLKRTILIVRVAVELRDVDGHSVRLTPLGCRDPDRRSVDFNQRLAG